MADLRVVPAICVVPAGGDADTMRLSLRVTPTRPPTGGAGEVDLTHWPEKIAEISRQVRIEVAPVTGAFAVGTPVLVGMYPTRGWTGVPAAGAKDLWEATFASSELAMLWAELLNPGGPATVAAGEAIAPRIDLQTLGEELVRNRTSAVIAQVNRLLGRRRAGPALLAAPPPASSEAALTELEAWAVPGSSSDSFGQLRDRAALTARAQHVKSAVEAVLARHPGVSPAWREIESHAKLDALHAAEQLQGRFDPLLAEAVAASAPRDRIDLLASRMESLMLAAAASSAPPAVAVAAAVEPGENERRKLAAILSYPTLAKYLGMILDVEIPRREWERSGLGGRGAVTAGFGSAGISAPIWSAYVDLPADATKGPSYFGPCDKDEAIGSGGDNQKFSRGMLNLGATYLKDSEQVPRYSLQIVDAVNSALRQNAYARSALRAMRTEGRDGGEKPELGARGIALIDHRFDVDENEAVQREQELEKPQTTTKLLFANDLLVGYRPAVGITLQGKDDLKVQTDRWRSLVGRTITFDRRVVDETFVRLNFDAEREYGHARSPIGRQPDRLLNHSELFVWTGESLAAPPPREGRPPEMSANAEQDLPVGITFGLPRNVAGSQLSLPPLREGRRYVFGVSAMFVNGCGPGVAESIATHFADSKHLLGDADRRAYRFTGLERIPPPVLLLRAGTLLVTASNLDRHYGESLTTLVVRESGPRAQRYLFPARLSFDRAEQQKMFGRDDGQKPRGAFQRVGVRRNRKNGDFARAVGGSIDDDLDPPGTGAEQSRGPVLEFEDPSPGAVEREYYPDSFSRGVWTRFGPIIPSNGTIEAMTAAVPYRTTAKAVDALPVMLELKRARPNAARRGRIDPDDTVSPDRPNDIVLRKISIELAPATVVDVVLDTDFDPNLVLGNHFIGAALASHWNDPGLRTARPGQELGRALSRARIEDLQGATPIRLVYAVEKPLAAPVNRGIFPALATVAPKNSATPGLRTWLDIVGANSGGIPPKPLDQWSEEGGATCFFLGHVDIDRPSTGSISLDGRWQDWGPEMVRHDEGADPPWSLVRPDQVARLFTLSDVGTATSGTGTSAADRVSLVGPLDKPHGLAFAFRDGRARKLTTALVTTSRFVEYYERDGATSKTPFQAARCERLSDRQTELWIPCNFRPAPPQVERITPWFNYAVEGGLNTRIYTVKRKASYRLELGRDCYSSGDGELIGLVFNADEPAICNYATQVLKPFAHGVTRWGRDPLHDVAVPALNITPDRFTGHVLQKTLQLFPGADPVDNSAGVAPPLEVIALGYPIHFDDRTGQFYCDIQCIDRNGSGAEPFMPFVQLGLVRFQPNAIRGLELSLPIGETIQLLPRREATVEFARGSDSGRRISVDLVGPQEGRGATRLDITALLRRDSAPDAPRWVPQTRYGSGEVAQLVNLPSNRPNGWRIDEFLIPRYRNRHHCGLLIEEYEVYQDLEGTMQKKIIFGYIVDFGAP